jgi:hypothetical protein
LIVPTESVKQTIEGERSTICMLARTEELVVMLPDQWTQMHSQNSGELGETVHVVVGTPTNINTDNMKFNVEEQTQTYSYATLEAYLPLSSLVDREKEERFNV